MQQIQKSIRNTLQVFCKKNFETSVLGEVSFYLGIKIEKGIDRYYCLSQEQYISKIIKDAVLENSKVSAIPMDVGYVKEDDNTELLPNNQKYRHLIGSLLYLAINTRPDIATAVSILSRKVNTPSNRDWIELKRLIRYLKGTKSMKLYLKCENEKGLYGFADADWAQNKSDRKSNSGFIFKYNGSPISWCCRKQDCVSLSSTEAEYISLCESAQEAIWLRRLMNDFEICETKPSTIYEDNQSCLKLVQSEKFSRRSKHIATKYYFIKDLNEKGEISLEYCPTEIMEADIFTKPLLANKIRQFQNMLCLK